MRIIPVDVSGLKVIATGVEPAAVNKYADGVRQEAHEVDDKGRPLVPVSLFVLTTEGAEEIRVKVPAGNVPKELSTRSCCGLIGGPRCCSLCQQQPGRRFLPRREYCCDEVSERVTTAAHRPEADEVWACRLAAVVVGTCIASLIAGGLFSALISAVLPWDLSLWRFLIGAVSISFCSPHRAAQHCGTRLNVVMR